MTTLSEGGEPGLCVLLREKWGQTSLGGAKGKLLWREAVSNLLAETQEILTYFSGVDHLNQSSENFFSWGRISL